MTEKLKARTATNPGFWLHFRTVRLKVFSLGLVSLLLLVGFSSTFVEAAPPTPPVGSATSLSGTLSMIWGDPAPNSSRLEETLYALTNDAGQTYQLEINPKTVQAPNGLAGLYNKRVKLTATVTNAPAASSNPNLSVQAIELDTTPGARTAPGATPGSNPFISIMCRYAGNSTSPQTQTFFTNQLSNTKPGFDNYIQELSYGQYNLTGSKAAGWFDLPPSPQFLRRWC